MKPMCLSSLAAVVVVSLAGMALFSGCINPGQAYQQALVKMENETGLKAVQIPGTTNQYLGKIHNGYQVVYYAQAGNVWGRYAARLTMGELGREAGGIISFLTGGSQSAAGSTLDRLLAKAIGQPLSVTFIMKHGKPDAPRMDILSGFSNIQPEDPQPKRARVGFKAGHIYAADETFAARIAANKALMNRLSNLRCQYIRLDKDAVTFAWSGQENDYSGMIMDNGGYEKMLNAIMDDLSDIANSVPGK